VVTRPEVSSSIFSAASREAAKRDSAVPVFLGSGSRFAASREAALKMLELTSGRVTTLCETYLVFVMAP